jgi:TRAP-type C4-dicarboxylate transport system permease small subunit
MSDEKINALVGITDEQRRGIYKHIGIYNHDWQNPETFKTPVLWTSYFLMIGFFMFCFVCGVRESYSQWLQKTPSMRIPMTLPKLAVPVGFGIMVMFGLELFLKDVRKFWKLCISK